MKSVMTARWVSSQIPPTMDEIAEVCGHYLGDPVEVILRDCGLAETIAPEELELGPLAEPQGGFRRKPRKNLYPRQQFQRDVKDQMWYRHRMVTVQVEAAAMVNRYQEQELAVLKQGRRSEREQRRRAADEAMQARRAEEARLRAERDARRQQQDRRDASRLRRIYDILSELSPPRFFAGFALPDDLHDASRIVLARHRELTQQLGQSWFPFTTGEGL